MKPSISKLKKALKACAEAHRADFCDWEKIEGALAVSSDNVPTVCDVRSICEAFFGDTRMVSSGYGFTTVNLKAKPFLPEVNKALLSLALPYGTKI
jgi:hypothetical protein